MENIYLLSGPEKFYCELECMKGMRDAFQNNGKQNVSDYFIQTNMGKEDAFRKTLQLLKTEKPDAIVTTSESLALGIIEGIRLIGYTTADIPIFTLGEQHWNLNTQSFATTSLVRPAMNLGKKASKLLLEQLESPLTKESEKIILAGCSTEPEDERNHLSVKKKIEKEQKKLRVLMLDTPQVESISGLIPNFEKRTGIKMEIITMPHHKLYHTILTTYSENPEKSYDVFMYDMPWLSFFATEGILEDISDKMKEIH
ncbi:MAG: substrate-binding domain-containing protein, partial [Bacillota bacterium]|nr:substrate-binding domain-containing protein [Bacillota bacterium]